MENKKKAVAAMAAVMEYITAEEEAVRFQSMAAPGVLQASTMSGGGPVKLWGVSGRQAQMQMRSLMQLRTFR
ncbi:MAG: hypothetical protein WB792_11290 [Desulfobacterales bacterium]